MMALVSVSAIADGGLLGKGGGSGGGSGSGNSGGGNSGGSGSGGGREAPPPPVRSGGNSGGGSGSGSSGGSGGGLGKGGGGGNTNSGGGSSNSGGSSSGGRDRDGGSSNSGGGLGRPQSNSGNQQKSDNLIGRGGNEASRSGSVRYEGSNNQASSRSRDSFNIPEPPTVRSDSRIRSEGWNEGNVTRSSGRYRSGYVHYNNGWNDNNFWYPHYSFNYYEDRCFPSPWYYYPHLPAYINIVRIEIGNTNFRWDWRSGSRHNWRYDRPRNDGWGWGGGYNNTNEELDFAIDDLYDAFRRGRIRYMTDLIPSNGRIWVELDRYTQYQLNGDDFYDLMRDLVEGTYTTDFRVREVRTFRGGASLVADHVYRDPWGRTRSSRHSIGLSETRRGYEIVAYRIED